MSGLLIYQFTEMLLNTILKKFWPPLNDLKNGFLEAHICICNKILLLVLKIAITENYPVECHPFLQGKLKLPSLIKRTLSVEWSFPIFRYDSMWEGETEASPA